jgi:hypothetical protein
LACCTSPSRNRYKFRVARRQYAKTGSSHGGTFLLRSLCIPVLV